MSGVGGCVVFLHGIGGSAAAWSLQQATFKAAGWETLPLDLPGYGARPPVDEMSFEGLAADVERSIAVHGLDRPVLVGHSMGGMIAQTLLRRSPRGYRAAVLACTSPAFGNPTGDFQRQFVSDRLSPLDAGKSMRELAPAMVLAMLGPKPEPAAVALATVLMGATPADTYRAAVRCLVGFDERANLGAIAVPVLCLAAEHDRNAPAAMMERMTAKIPGARYVCLAGAGHLPNLEAPAAFDRAVLSFLSTLDPSTTA